jgi:uncharacterized membrane protein YraQ (UPF0718 family)
MDIVQAIVPLLRGGLSSLGAYLAAHVLLCLIPAFFVAGALTALVPRESVTRFLGRSVPRSIAYPAAAAAGSLLAVCSCTIVPLFAAIHRKGAGLGPAMTFLFFAPAGNVLALAYTGAALGSEFAVARVVLSLAFGIGIGLVMAAVFRSDDVERARSADDGFAGGNRFAGTNGWLLGTLVALLLFGTLKVRWLVDPVATFTLPVGGSASVERWLFDLAPYDAARGEEGVTLHGAVLVGLLLLIALAAWKGFATVLDGVNRWTVAALSLVALTLMVAAVRVVPAAEAITIELPGKFFGVLAALASVAGLARYRLGAEELRQWLWESWRFVRQIFPILVVGVFLVGMARVLIRPEWIETVAGANTVTANLAGVAFGIVMYFPTLVEVPVAKMFLALGMHPGPLMAYLMADPELSLQSILMTMAVIGRTKALAYVGLVALFSTLAGLAFGAWTDGMSALWLVAGLGAFAGTLAFAVYALQRHAPHARLPT